MGGSHVRAAVVWRAGCVTNCVTIGAYVRGLSRTVRDAKLSNSLYVLCFAATKDTFSGNLDYPYVRDGNSVRLFTCMKFSKQLSRWPTSAPARLLRIRRIGAHLKVMPSLSIAGVGMVVS